MKIKNSFINTSHFIQKTLLAASLMFVTVHAINAEENFSEFEPMDVFIKLFFIFIASA